MWLMWMAGGSLDTTWAVYYAPVRHGAGLQEDRVTQADVALAFRSGWGETGLRDWRGWGRGGGGYAPPCLGFAVRKGFLEGRL